MSFRNSHLDQVTMLNIRMFSIYFFLFLFLEIQDGFIFWLVCMYSDIIKYTSRKLTSILIL